jgi:multiple sugar transport system ATP-binding protein
VAGAGFGTLAGIDVSSTGVSIDVEDVSRVFGPVRALDGVSLSVAPGEMVALLGPSGSGKSTLLRICAGLEQPSAGDVRFGGVSQLGIPPHRRDVSMVFQHFALYPHLTALDNLVLALRYGRGMPKVQARARARETLRMLGIGALAGRRPAQMSGGQRQRVAIGRALATRAKVVLLDEPMSGLDAKLRVELRVEIVALLRRLGTTALFVTHDQAEAMAVGHRVAVLSAGRLEQIGTPDEIYDRPATRFVAGFVGSPPMNVCDGTWSDGLLRGDGFALAAPAGSAAFGVRPEHLRMVPGGTSGPGPAPGAGAWAGAGGVGPAGGLRLTGRVVVSERLGADRSVYVETRAGLFAVRMGAQWPAPGGSHVELEALPSSLAFFGVDGNLLPSHHLPAPTP